MSVKIFVPRDSTAIALGANEVANAIVAEAKARGVAIQLVRNGSRGMFWLEPMVGRPMRFPISKIRNA